jgi:hypothetical protein
MTDMLTLCCAFIMILIILIMPVMLYTENYKYAFKLSLFPAILILLGVITSSLTCESRILYI